MPGTPLLVTHVWRVVVFVPVVMVYVDVFLGLYGVANAGEAPDTSEMGTFKTVAITIVPEQAVAVPRVSVAEVGALVNSIPPAVITKAVPPAIAFGPVSATVAVAPDPPPLVMVTMHVAPTLPVKEPPLVYVPEATTEFCK